MGRPVSTAGRTVVEWWTTMDDPDDGEITLPGCLLLRFAPDGRCADLWEYWQVQPGRQDPPAGWGESSRSQPCPSPMLERRTPWTVPGARLYYEQRGSWPTAAAHRLADG